ncbi:hypothetical protein GCM10018780_81960 [Streptomyces lanatus]|nr:hypothetical protein GCM10018780_81960 [Streptomyces lanatus]
MRLRENRELWLEPAHADWLALPDFHTLPVQVRLPDAALLDQTPGRRAADWALRPVPLVLPAAAPALRPAALVLAAHTCTPGEHSTDMDILTPPVRALPATDRRITRPAGDHTHPEGLAEQPGDRRSDLATAPAADPATLRCPASRTTDMRIVRLSQE